MSIIKHYKKSVTAALGAAAAAAAAPALVGLVLAPPIARADETAIFDKVSDSLVYIGIEYTGKVRIPAEVTGSGKAVWSDSTTVQYTCSGFVVDPSGFIATAGHCVDIDASVKADIREQMFVDAVNAGAPESEAKALLDQANADQWAVEGKEPESPIDRHVVVIQPEGPNRVIDDPITVQVVDLQKSNDGDNALLKASGVAALKPLVIADAAPKPGQALTAIGFPGSVTDVADPARLPRPSFKSGTASSQQVKPSGASTTEINADVSFGMSGGPTIDNATGKVLGINSFGIKGEKQAFNFITDAPALRAFLQKNGVQLATGEQPPATGKSDTSSFPWMWVIIGLLAAALVAVLIVLLVVMNRKKGGHQQQPVSFGQPVSVGPPVQVGQVGPPEPPGSASPTVQFPARSGTPDSTVVG